MRQIWLTICCVAFLMVGCKSENNGVEVPEKEALLEAASNNGKYDVTIERYDPKEKIASVYTPGWLPENKPYQFDGKEWIPLWSPYLAPELE